MSRTYKYHFIYHIRILVGSKKDYFYVGLHSTNNIDDGYSGSGTRIKHIIKGLRKKGYKKSEIYERTILTFATSRKEVVELEELYVTKEIKDNKYCLNERIGGETCCEVSDKVRTPWNKGKKGVQTAWNKGKKGVQTAWNKGKSPSAESRDKMSKAHSGKSPWNKGKKGVQTAWNKGKKGVQTAWNKGKSPSDESRDKMSKAHAGKSPWNKGKKGVQVAWNKGIPATDDAKEKNRQAHLGRTPWNKGKKGVQHSPTKGKTMSDEQRMKISNTKKGSHRVYHEDGTYHYEKNAS